LTRCPPPRYRSRLCWGKGLFDCWSPACWLPSIGPWLIASAFILIFYFIVLIESYRVGDLGQVDPLARGSAPLMTAAVSAFFISERLIL
jgi:hypothetical protein